MFWTNERPPHNAHQEQDRIRPPAARLHTLIALENRPEKCYRWQTTDDAQALLTKSRPVPPSALQCPFPNLNPHLPPSRRLA